MDIRAELQNFKAINLDEIIKDGTQIPDKIRNSIFLYNKAIESLRTGSEDIATIELKKATSMNPQFFEALNLLGLCYGYSGEKEKAAEVFNKVIRAESNSIVAMNYMRKFGLVEAIQPQKERPVKQAVGQIGDKPLKRIRNTKESAFRQHEKKQQLVNVFRIGIGFTAGLIISLIVYLSLPPKVIETPVEDKDKTEAVINDLKARHKAEYDELRSKYDLALKDREDAIKQTDYYKLTIRLYEVEDLTEDKKYEEAADMLLLMKTVEFTGTEKEKFDELIESVMPKAAKSAHDEGYKLYNSRKYQESLKRLEKVEVYDSEYTRMDAVLYYMGRNCQILHDSRNAVTFYQRLINNHPKSWYIGSAKSRINELTKIP